jgi:hypothetical protein
MSLSPEASSRPDSTCPPTRRTPDSASWERRRCSSLAGKNQPPRPAKRRLFGFRPGAPGCMSYYKAATVWTASASSATRARRSRWLGDLPTRSKPSSSGPGEHFSNPLHRSPPTSATTLPAKHRAAFRSPTRLSLGSKLQLSWNGECVQESRQFRSVTHE